MANRRAHDVVIVGAGVMGLAAAWALTREGRDVLVLEQFRVGHDRGSSHGSSRIFRLVHDEPEWVRLGQEALGLWRELERDVGERILERTGLVDVWPDPARVMATLESCGVGHELLEPDEVERRFSLRVGSDRALFQPEAGIVWAGRALSGFRAAAERRGARVAEETRVRSLVPYEGGVRVESDTGTIEAEVAVVAAGAWAKGLLATAGIDLPVTPTGETVAYFTLAADELPPSVIDRRKGDEHYGLAAGVGRLKVGVHHAGPVIDPEGERGAPDRAAVHSAVEWASRTYRLAQPGPDSTETCLYTSTADWSFVLERQGPIVVCSACSGHGFKFAPAVGVRLARLSA